MGLEARARGPGTASFGGRAAEAAQLVQSKVGCRVQSLPADAAIQTPPGGRIGCCGKLEGRWGQLTHRRHLLVLLQAVSVTLPPGEEAGAAVRTGEGRWRTRMAGEAVRRQLGSAAEGGGAVGAAVLRLSGSAVQQAVLPQVGGLREAAVADVAAVRPLAGVREAVAAQVGQ